MAYYEHPSYVMLLKRAYELWREIEARAGEHRGTGVNALAKTAPSAATRSRFGVRCEVPP